MMVPIRNTNTLTPDEWRELPRRCEALGMHATRALTMAVVTVRVAPGYAEARAWWTVDGSQVCTWSGRIGLRSIFDSARAADHLTEIVAEKMQASEVKG